MQKALTTFFLVCLFLSFSSDFVFCQSKFTQTQIDSIIKKRWDFRSIRKNYPKSEMEIIKVIKRCCPNEVDSMAEISTEKIKNEDYRSALSWFEVVLEEEPENLTAHYGIGICKRELGRASFIERMGFWPSSEKHFEQVIEIDSTYQDVLYQYSLLESYREKDEEAIRLIDRQLEIDEFDNEFEGKRLQLYDKLLYENSYDDAKEWFESRKTIRDIYYLGELYRVNGQFEIADSIYQNILTEEEEDFPAVQVYLSLVRLYVQTGQYEKAEETYWQAVESVSSELEEQLVFEDFIYIIKENEYDLLKKGLPFYLLSEAYRTFWLERNPMPAAPYNYRLVEHYRRLVYAEKEFRYYAPRRIKSENDKTIQTDNPNYPLMDTFSFPEWYYENYKFNDEALIYIRFGEPDEKAFAFPKPASAKPKVREDPEPATPGNMSWLYNQTGNRPQMIFHFIIPDSKYSIGEINSWKLIPGFFQPEIVDELVGWDGKYHNINAFGSQLIAERIENIDFAFQNDFHTWPKETRDLGLTYSMAHFCKNKDEDIVQLSYAFPLSNLIDNKTKNNNLTLETGVVVFDNNMIQLYKDVKNCNVTNKTNAHVWQDWFIDEFEFPLELSRYNIALHARVLDENKVSGYQYNYTLSDSLRGKLFCSSLKLAFHISPKTDSEIRHRDNLIIIPNPSKHFRKDETLYAYFEIYNLGINTEAKTNYSLNFMLTQKENRKNVFSKITGIFGGKEKYKVSIQNDYEGGSLSVSDYMNFDISRLDKGDYEIRMIVKDNVSGKESLTMTDFVLK